MDMTTPLTLLLSGLCVAAWCLAQNPYILFTTPKTWYEAQSHCREVCHDLTTVDDMDHMQTLIDLTEGRYDDGVWIGLYKTNIHRWHWSLPDEDLYEAGERNYASITGSDYNCVSYENGTIHSAPCSIDRHPVCYDPDAEYEEQYTLGPLLTSWPAARDYCRSNYTDLASVRNADEDEIIWEVSLGLPVYIGAFKDTWEWSDGTYSSMRYWNPTLGVYSSSEGTCAAMLRNHSGKWGERSCGAALPYLCTCPTNWFMSQVKIMVKDAGLNMSDPAVQGRLLEQMRKRLNKIDGTHLQLRWKKHPQGNVFVKIPP